MLCDALSAYTWSRLLGVRGHQGVGLRPVQCWDILLLRHACGFALADQGADTRLIQDYLGHRNMQHTVMYTATNPARFERLWR